MFFVRMDATGSRNILKNLLPPTFGSPGDFGQNYIILIIMVHFNKYIN